MTNTGGTMTENTRGSFVVGKIEPLSCNDLLPKHLRGDDVKEAIGEMNEKIAEHKETPGGSTPSQYQLPDNATDLQDLIEHRDMNFAMGNIFKACYRSGNCSHSDLLRDINKVLWFANRERERLTNKLSKP